MPTIRLWGPPALILPGEPPSPLAPRDAALLARLALDGPRVRVELARWLWPHRPQPAALSNLRQRIRHWQKRCTAEVLVSRGDELAVGETVSADRLGLDAGADGAATGLPLQGLDFDAAPGLQAWVADARLRLRRARADHLVAAADREEAAGEPRRALQAARAWLAGDPHSAAAVLRVMRLLLGLGEPAAALDEYRRWQATNPDDAEDAAAAALARACRRAADELSTRSASELVRAMVTRPPVLVGREQALQTLQHWRQAGGVVVLSGASGLGKSRLLQTSVTQETHALLLTARAEDRDTPGAFMGRWVQARRALLDRLPEAQRGPLLGLLHGAGVRAGELPPLPRQRQAWAPLASGLEAVLIDNLHHVDEASQELLPAVLDAVPRVALSLWPQAAEGPLLNWLAQHPGPRHDIELRAWTRSEVESAIDSLSLPGLDAARWAAAMHRHTGGHPLLVLETLSLLQTHEYAADPEPVLQRHLVADGRRADVLASALRRLSHGARRLAIFAALAEDPVTAEQSNWVLADPARAREAVDELHRLGHTDAEGRLHDLFAQAARRAMQPEERRELHLLVARWLAGRPGRLAHGALHWAEAGDAARAAEAYEQAAGLEQAHGRTAAEAQHLQRAAHAWLLARQPGRADAAELRAAEAWVTHGDMERGDALAAALCLRPLPPAAAAAARRVRALAAGFRMHWPEALALSLEAADLARQAGDDTERAEALSMSAAAAASLRQLDRALDLLEEEASLPHDPRHWRRSISRYGMVAGTWQQLDQPDRALRALEAGIRMARHPHTQTALLTMLGNRAMLLQTKGRHEEALASALEALGGLQDIEQGHSAPLANALIRVATSEATLGRFRDAVPNHERALEVTRAPDLLRWHRQAENGLAWCWTMLGQLARAHRIATDDASDLNASERMRRWTLRVELARLGERPLDPGPMPPLQGVSRPVAEFARLLQARGLPAAQRTVVAEAVMTDAERGGLTALARAARLEWLEACASDATVDTRRWVPEALALLSDWRAVSAASCYGPDLVRRVCVLLNRVGERAAAARAAGEARAWIEQTAGEHVPAPWQDSFRRLNAANRALLAMRP